MLGIVTGMPMEFQFGSNWTGFAKAAGGRAANVADCAREGLWGPD